MKLKITGPWILATAFLAGCATPKSVVEIEKNTSLNTAALSQQLQAFADNHKRIVTAREQTYGDEVVAAAALQSKLDSLVAIQRLAGNSDIVSLYQNMVSESDLVASNHVATLNLLSDTVAQIDQGIDKVAAPSKQLDTIAKNLADLANQDSFQDRAKALFSFYSDVGGLLAKQQAAGTNALSRALGNSPTNSPLTAIEGKIGDILKIR